MLIPAECPVELAKAIEACARDGEIRVRLGEAARAHVRAHFDLRRSMERTLEFSHGALVMTVSVIMAAYNVRPYVAEAVQSILSQSVADLELIVVDDGSTDGTDAVLGSFSDQRITVLRNRKSRCVPRS